MGDRFLRMGVEIPLSLYANLDNIKNGSAASGRILDAVKKEKQDMERIYKDYKYRPFKTYKNSVYGEMGCKDNG
jgi:hypothetical protein